MYMFIDGQVKTHRNNRLVPLLGTTKIKQISDIIYLNDLSVIYIHLNIHLILLVPPTVYDYLRVDLFIMPDPFTALVFSSKVG
jgi:hypothetical protein